MGKIVTNLSSGKEEELGKTATCFESNYKGWGTDCEKLVLKEDGHYHCLDCGLVRGRPVLVPKFKKPLAGTIQCECRELDEFCEMIPNDFFGYDVPCNYYRCSVCQLVYCYEETSYVPVEKQESEAATNQVKRIFEMLEREHAEELKNLSDDVDELKSRLERLSDQEKKRLLDRLL